ncbi:piggyBac transposable element-derived protein 3-like [Sipha flava]|uniref:PiggyBac transposable element-derived protein 3-like n=1 Tax=Sipha flava TaxID=143950 RepID=A0A8B8FBH9_9HEMI|nr:piggyBac transposable element-derived protein 3-like [Sipha flava]
MEMLKKKCIDNFIPEQHLAYDESKSPKANTVYEQLFGKAASPLLVLIDEIPEEKRQLSYSFYMDNLFSEFKKTVLYKIKNYLQKKERGYFETAMDKNDGLLYVRWMDNAVVTMISTSCGTKEISHVKRYSQQKKTNILVQRPSLIAKYNTYMGGTDQMDQNLGCYRIGVRGKKWYWPLVTWMFDIAMQNRSGRISKSICSTDSRISDTLRYDKTDHLVQHTEEKKKKKMCRKKLQLNCTNNVFKMLCWVMY